MPVPFSSIRALSFHKIPTQHQPITPTRLSIKSYCAKCSIPRMLIANSTQIELNHLIYQLRSPLGVFDLYILLLCSISATVNSSPLSVVIVAAGSGAGVTDSVGLLLLLIRLILSLSIKNSFRVGRYRVGRNGRPLTLGPLG